MKNIHIALCALFISASQIVFAIDEQSLPGAPNPNLSLTKQDSYQSETVQAIDLSKLYTVQLAMFKVEENADRWVSEQKFKTDNIGIAKIIDKGKINFMVATGVYEGLLKANNAAEGLCQQHKVEGCRARRLSRLEALSKEAEELSLQLADSVKENSK